MENKYSITKNITLKSLILGIVMLSCCAAYCETPSLSADTSISQSIQLPSDIEEYTRLTRKSIKDKWYPPTASYENAATIVLSIDREGKLINCHLSEPSPDKGFNDSLIEAAKKATYPPIPKRIFGDSIEISLSFGMQRHHISK